MKKSRKKDGGNVPVVAVPGSEKNKSSTKESSSGKQNDGMRLLSMDAAAVHATNQLPEKINFLIPSIYDPAVDNDLFQLSIRAEGTNSCVG